MSDTPPRKAVSKAQWGKAKVHEGITLPSGAVVDIQIPNVTEMAKSGELPNSLLEVATKVATTQTIPDDYLGQLYDFQAFLVTKTVVKPEVTLEDVPNLPAEDVVVLVQFATRERDMDVLGHHLAGLEKIDEYRRFHGLDRSPEDFLG